MWSDDYSETDARPWENVPDYSFVEDAYGYDETDAEYIEPECPDVSSCSNKIHCQADMLRLFRNMFDDDRAALIYLARKVWGLKYADMAEIFRLDASGICRTVKKSERTITR